MGSPWLHGRSLRAVLSTWLTGRGQFSPHCLWPEILPGAFSWTSEARIQ